VTALAMLALVGQLTAGAEPLTNAHIVDMARARMPDAAVIAAIQSRTHVFDLSVQGLVALKQAGISDAVLEAMLHAAESPRGTGLAVPLPEDQGVYWLAPEGAVPLPLENINQRTVGGVRHTGAIDGAQSRVRLVPPLTIIIRAAENVGAEEHVLIQLYRKKKFRHFQMVSTAVLTRSPNRMEVPFEAERIAPAVYRVRVTALPRGEYGFVRPGTPQRLGPGGVPMTRPDWIGAIYTFGVN
jgi:hypothetical protein